MGTILRKIPGDVFFLESAKGFPEPRHPKPPGIANV